MHKRIVFAVSIVLFALVAPAAGIMADLHDRDYPVQLGVRVAGYLEFDDTGMSDAEAFRELGTLSDRFDLGLLKVAPDLSGDQSGQIFVMVGNQDNLPDTIPRFGDQPDARISTNSALANSYASGLYLVAGNTTHLEEFKTWLTAHGVSNRWSHDTFKDRLLLLVRQSSFATSMLAAIALMVSLVLYWLSVKAKGRALRVLAGVPAWRIQFEDLGRFLVTMAAAASICFVVALIYVGVAHGWVFVPHYARELLTFKAIVILATMVCAVAMSVASWPNVRMLVAREPAVKSLRKVSVALKGATFALVLIAVAPALAAYTDSKAAAAQQAQWNSLADQVAVSFPAGTGESGFQELMPIVGNLVSDAEQRDAVALSYTWTDEILMTSELEPFEGLSLVNQRWLDLMLTEVHSGGNKADQSVNGLIPLTPDQVPHNIEQFLDAQLPLLMRDDVTGVEALSQLSFYRNPESLRIPLSLGGSGELVFPDDAIIVVAPSVHKIFDDNFLTSVASTRNLIFTGLGQTQALIAQHGLRDRVEVKYVAEEGVLRAQLTAYFAWLQGVSLVALIVALATSALIGAFITAVLNARRDFPLRLAGKRWAEVLADRVAREWGAGATILG